MRETAFLWRLLGIMWFFLMLVGCRSAREFTISPPPAIEETGVQSPPSPSSTMTIALPTATPSINYQLTFTSVQRVGYSQQMYAIEVGCLAEDPPCFGEPELLLEVPWPGRAGLPPIQSFDWSPDGKRVVWDAGHINERGDIVVTDWNGQNRVNLSRSPGPDSFPSWSRDGNRILFETTIPKERTYLVSVKPDGTNEIELLTQADIDISPGMASFSPDGKQVIFTNFNVDGPYAGLYQVYLANLDGSDLKQLTQLVTNYGYISFSLDGGWIVFEREMDPNTTELDTHLFLMRLDGGDEVALTENMPGRQWRPAWAPFGEWIAFIQSDENEDSLYLIRADGSRLVLVAQNQGDIGHIAWRTVFEP